MMPAIAAAQPLAFAVTRGDQGNAVLRVINTTTGTTTATYDIGSPNDQASVVALADGEAVFVAIGTRLMRLRVETGVVSWTEFPQPLGQMVVSPDHWRLYISQRLAPAMYVVDAVTGATVGSPMTLPFVASKIALSRTGDRLFVLSPESQSAAGQLAVVSVVSGAVQSTITTEPGALQVTAHPDGARAFVANSTFETTQGNGDSVVAYDIASGMALGRLTLPDNRASADYWPGPVIVYYPSQAGQMAITPGGHLYIPRSSAAPQKGGATYYNQVVDVVDVAAMTRVTSSRLPKTMPPWFAGWGGIISAYFETASQRLWVASGNGLWEIDSSSHAAREISSGLLEGLKDVAIAPAPACWFEVGASALSFRNNGGVAHITVPAPPQGCGWSATVSDNWISASPASGTGPGTVTVIVGPSDTPRSGTITVGAQPVTVSQRIMYAAIDMPAAGAIVSGAFTIAGWALDHDGRATGALGSGIEEVRVTGETPGQPVRLLATPYPRRARPDVAAVYGSRFESSGFREPVAQLAEGRRLIVVRAKSALDGTWLTTSVEVTVPRLVFSAIDGPPVQETSTPRLRFSGWAMDRNVSSGCGIATVHVWAFPHAGGAPMFFGATPLGRTRQDLTQVYGSQAVFCGWELLTPLPPPAGYRVVAYAFTTATGTAETEAGVDVTIRHRPFGVVDTPVAGAQVAGAISITGWALDDGGVERIAVFLSETGEWIADATFVEGARPDVAAAYASYPRRTRAGWGVSVLTNMLPHAGNGNQFFNVIAYDTDGQQTLLKTLHVYGVNGTSMLPFGQIDLPAQGATISGIVPIFGWALTRSPNIIPADGSTIEVIVDTVMIGRPVFGQCRGTNGTNFPAAGTCNDDIARTFGLGYRNLAETSGAIGSFLLDTTTLSNGIHSLVWRVTDSGGNVQGIGSRYVYVNNTPSATGR
jgi:hypothetical protein